MYSIEQLSMISGLTTRTLRNYLKSGILTGSKESGIWQFSEEEVGEFLNHPAVRPSIHAKQQAIVYDFLSGQESSDQEMCVLLDRKISQTQAKELADRFCQAAGSSDHIRFSYSYAGETARFILKGSEEEIREILRKIN